MNPGSSPSRLVLAALALLLAALCAVPALAQVEGASARPGRIESVWRKQGNTLELTLSGSPLICVVDNTVRGNSGDRTYVLRDKDQRLMKTLLRVASGANVILYVSDLVPGLVVGVEDSDGVLVRGELIPQPPTDAGAKQ